MSHDVQKKHCAVQSCRAPSHQSDIPGSRKPQDTGTITPCGYGKASAPGEKLNGSHCPSSSSFPEMLTCGEKDRAELHQKGKVIREIATHWSESLESDLGISR